MKRRCLNKIIAGVMTFAFIANSAVFSVSATETDQTYYGAEETVKVSSGLLDRENNFNERWKFYLGTSSTAQNKNFDDSSWKSVNLPHDFSITQSYTTSGEAESGFLPGGTGWYRKTFTMPSDADDKNVILNFDGVYSDAYVYVNGTYVGEHHYGYTDFAFDITEHLTADGTENVIAVKAVNNVPTSRWYSGSGIYRDVTLIVTDDIHVDYHGTQITTPDIANGTGTVKVAVDVVNDGTAAANVTVTNTVYKKGEITALASGSTTVGVSAGATETAESSAVVSNPSLWSIESPNQYTVITELTVDGTVVDTYETDFGFRWFSFDSEGFHLNGKNVKLNGVCMHHDQGALGSAAYYDAMYRQLSKMKDMGCNAIRTAHNPADEQYIDICNELGLLVIEEAFDGWNAAKNGNSYDFSTHFTTYLSADNGILGGSSSMTWAKFAVKAVAKRDRNDPSVIAWSLGNEIQEGAYTSSDFPTIAGNLIEWIHEVDTTRPTTIGDNTRGGNSTLVSVINTITSNDGIAGFNYANTADTLYSLAQSYGGSKGAIIASETASATNSRGQYRSQVSNNEADGNYHLTSYDTSAVGWGITAHDSIYNTYQYDSIAGEFVWTGFDYLGEPTPWNGTGTGTVGASGSLRAGTGATPNSSYFGIVETTGFEKDTYYLYRSQWNKDETTLHLVTAWDSDNMMTTSSKTPVWVYSNAPIVKLYRGDTLIGTATRVEHTSPAGHTYYTYTTTSNSSSICSTSSGSNADGLYAVFNVAYEAGTLSAKAFEADETTEITLTGNSGKNTVTTPDAVSKLKVSVNKTEMDADGSSLAYVTVDVTDANDNLDTTATNNIEFTLTGAGEIVGVDNGDQATTAKYQQTSVLPSSTSANINAYAGKALAIIRSTEEAGVISVDIASNGLIGETVSIQTIGETDSDTTASDLISYAMVRDYSVKEGTKPEMKTTAIGTLASGSEIEGVITWNEITESTYSTAGDYTINGSLSFEGYDTIPVVAKLHVIANVIAMRNISSVTTPETVPTLSNVVVGVLADGTLSSEFNVEWDEMTADQFTTVGDIITVEGMATVIGEETMPVTCTIRVTEAVNTDSVNAAKGASLSQNIAEANQSDNLESIKDGNTTFKDAPSLRWTNWNNRYNDPNPAITFTWATVQLLSSVNLYYYYDGACKYPDDILFEYSSDGETFSTIEYTTEEIQTVSLGAKYTYTFDKVINPHHLRITFTQKDGINSGYCVGLIEAEVMTFAGTVEYNTSATLSQISVDGKEIEDFAADTYEYTSEGSVVTAATEDNAGITVLPAYEGVVRILTVSEDGSEEHTYAVTVGEEEAGCKHTNTEVKNAADPTCTTAGYTGDEVCTDCGETITLGTAIEKLEHTITIVNEKAATCTETGYTGDSYCTVCKTTVSTGKSIAATGHKYESVTGTDGVTTYTCSVCNDSYQVMELIKPTASISAKKATSNKITLTGTFEDYENISKYYEITSHGIIYITKARLGIKTLTVNTTGRTKVNFGSYAADGSFSYTMKPTSTTTKYAARAFLSYVDEDGKTQYIYSDTITVSYNTLIQ